MGLVQDRVNWRVFVVAVLNLLFPLPENDLIENTNLTEIRVRQELNGSGSELCPGRALVLAVLDLLFMLPEG